jgi:hypothetical protein
VEPLDRHSPTGSASSCRCHGTRISRSSIGSRSSKVSASDTGTIRAAHPPLPARVSSGYISLPRSSGLHPHTETIMPPGRNSPCPCGSGRKYKHCCLARDAARGAQQTPRVLPLPAGSEKMQQQLRAAAAEERTWAADAIPLQVRIDKADAARPVGILVTAGEHVVHTYVRGRLRGEARDVAAVLEGAVVATAREVGVFPERLLVRHADVATALGSLLAPRPVAVEAAAVPALEDAALDLMETIAGRASWPPVCRTDTWGGWDLPLPLVARLFAAAARFYQLAPWRDIANVQAPRAVLPSGRAWTCCVLGNGAEQFGLLLYSEPSDLFDVTAHAAPEQPFSGVRGRIVSTTFYPMADASPAALHETRLHRWEVAGPAAYPSLLTVNTPGGGAARADIEDMIALFHALPAFVQQHRRALRHEAATAVPLPIDWVEPDSGIAFRYAGEAALRTERPPDHARFAPGGVFHGELQAAVREASAEVGEDADEAVLWAAVNRLLEQKMAAYDERPQSDLGGLSPAQVTRLLKSDWIDPHGAVQLRTDLTPDDVAHAHTVANARALLELALERRGLGATPEGYLEPDVVAALVDRVRYADDYAGSLRALDRRITEQDAGRLLRLRLVCYLAGLLQHRAQRVEPTPLARSLVQPDRAGELFVLLFRTWWHRFNTFYGGWVEWPELQHQIAFTLYRLPDAASDWRTAAELLDKVVLPRVLEERAPARNSTSPERAAVDFATWVLYALADFGLLSRRQQTPSPSLLNEEFRATPLARSAIRFAL